MLQGIYGGNPTLQIYHISYHKIRHQLVHAYSICHSFVTADQDLRDLIEPSPPTERDEREENRGLTSSNRREGRLFVAPYVYPVTKTETKTQVVVTGTTTVTFKCTPTKEIIPPCV